MSGISLVVDINILILLAEGKSNVDLYLEGNLLYISVITEMELLGHTNITSKEIKFFESLLQECTVVELLRPVKERAIKLRQHFKIKLPDAIIAATSMYLNVPLLTFDKDFPKVKGLDLVMAQ